MLAVLTWEVAYTGQGVSLYLLMYSVAVERSGVRQGFGIRPPDIFVAQLVAAAGANSYSSAGSRVCFHVGMRNLCPSPLPPPPHADRCAHSRRTNAAAAGHGCG
jgi:hypothetical protein